MYGMWIFVIIFAVISVICVTFDIYVSTKQSDVLVIVLHFISALSVVLCGIFIAFAIFDPCYAKEQYLKFENTRQLVQTLCDNGTELNNYIIQNIAEANQWLIEAKADKETNGIFSMYYCIDLDNVEPIIVNEGTK